MQSRGQRRLARQLADAVAEAALGRKPRVPEAGRTAWRWFVALTETRGRDLSGPLPISFAEIEAYGRLTGTPFQPHHVALIRAVDTAWLKVVREPAAAPGITPDIFDVVFR